MAAPPFPSLPASAPFVLLDDARGEGDARLYTDPGEVIIARTAAEVEPALARIEARSRIGHHLAGFIAYEAGLALEPRLTALAPARCGGDGPLIWFGAFDHFAEIPAAAMPAWLASQTRSYVPGAIGPLDPQLSAGGYARAFDRIKSAIVAGDIYQANLTLPLAGSWRGDPLAIYSGLRAAGGGGHGGVIYDGAAWLLSFSPELFVELADGLATARPMKGTALRGRDATADAAQAAELSASAKDRAEHLMIVDLLRNDLSRVARAGSVAVSDAFAIESYPTVHQMVTTIHAALLPGLGAAQLLRALFPCGSITGAPKIRAMELLAEVERDPRGAYCGAIGRIDPVRPDPDVSKASGSVAFNVAIRTLRLTRDADGAGPRNGGGWAVIGVGSAIVADSLCHSEWRECLAKGGFLQNSGGQQADQLAGAPAVARFDLIETMRFTPEHGVPLLERHLARLSASAAELGFACDRHAVRNAIHALCFAADAPAKLRLLLARSGAHSLEIAELPPGDSAPLACVVLPLPVDAGDWRLRHKCSDRPFYDAGRRAAAAAGAGEALLMRDDGLITEGCFTSLFVARDGQLLTPPLALGLLPGVLRASLIAEGRAVEAELRLNDLAGGFFLGNALRGLFPAELLA